MSKPGRPTSPSKQRLNKTEAGRQASKGRGHRPPVQKGREAGCQRAERAANRQEVRASNEQKSKGTRRTAWSWATHRVHEVDGSGISTGTQNTTHTSKNTRAANWGGDHRGTAGSPVEARWGRGGERGDAEGGDAGDDDAPEGMSYEGRCQARKRRDRAGRQVAAAGRRSKNHVSAQKRRMTTMSAKGEPRQVGGRSPGWPMRVDLVKAGRRRRPR